jgi:hypothetical protein
MNVRDKIRPHIGFMRPASRVTVEVLMDLIGDDVLETFVVDGQVDGHKLADEVLKRTVKSPQNGFLFWLYPKC